MNHNHTILKHTPQQAKIFFALSKTLGYDRQEVKDRAKKHFKIDCFNALTKDQMMWLIDQLVRKEYDKSSV